MADEFQVFDTITRELKGTTRIEVPRVSRETIISVLQSHTDMLKNIRKDHNNLSSKVERIDFETKENQEQIAVITEENIKRNADVVELFRMNNEFRIQIEELSWKVAELYTLKKTIEVRTILVFVGRTRRLITILHQTHFHTTPHHTTTGTKRVRG